VGVSKISINFEDILSRADRNFEEQNKVFEPSVIIINYSILLLLHIITVQLIHNIIINF